MTEAQYICTGGREPGLNLSHYGLGLEYYTHFTSPIRRYADIIVHKQLLASLEIENMNLYHQAAQMNSTKNKSKIVPHESLPSSNVVSILAGEGLKTRNNDEMSKWTNNGSQALFTSEEPELLDETNDTTLIQEENNATNDICPYNMTNVTSICEGLNFHNRLAKQSSFECQALFLSLYFRDHIEVTQAVVTQLRENGFWVYVPKFDIRGPVYIKDINNEVQIDPSLLGLPADTGLNPTLGFLSSPSSRRIPSGKTELFNDTNERLEVSVHIPNSKKFIVRPFDVVIVQLSCDSWDDRARVPSPRFLLLSRHLNNQDLTDKVSSLNKTINVLENPKHGNVVDEISTRTMEGGNKELSMFDLLSTSFICPILNEPLRRQTTKQMLPSSERIVSSFHGRYIFGGLSILIQELLLEKCLKV